MSKKSNKKSVKKKISKKPAPKKKAVKKAFEKSAKPKKKAAPKKIKAKKVNKASVKKKPLKKIQPKKQVVKTIKPATKPVVAKPVPVEKPVAVVKQKAPKPVKVVKPIVMPAPKKSVVIDIKTGPEPAGKFELEYVVHASSQILFEFITTPSGLSEWFCDDVNIRNGIYSFKWEENEQNARVVKLIEEKLVRFQWVDKQDNSYFEFRVERDDLTNDISLIIVDFAETPEERASSSLLWTSQIDKLLHVLGAYF
ncbi:MAG TPA: START-like domain-containing protein [Bacteroidia bacterium]|jgi:uncharacterized protein YndB with AHSA1/START domain|nr:START-like domain-containing protein [Bacteroidia bacterium]